MNWTIDSWKQHIVTQQPLWPNKLHLASVKDRLTQLPALVFAGETRNLRSSLTNVHNEKAFILHIGNCAESFNECNGPVIHDFLRLFNVLSSIVQENTYAEIIKIGRIAGQYSKPRSNDYEIRNGIKLPAFKGDNINDISFTEKSRTPNPDRLLEGYFHSAATLNLIRAFNMGDYDSNIYSEDWLKLPATNLKETDAYKLYIEGLTVKAKLKPLNATPVFVSHESLILDYEEAFTREDTIKGSFYNSSTHFLWLGDRTRFKDSAHVEYLRGISNPVGIKVGPNADFDELRNIIEIINPKNEINKIVLIPRFGKAQVEQKLSELIRKVEISKLNVIYVLDPMHGNTQILGEVKTRQFHDILDEVLLAKKIFKETKTYLGGLHLELTSTFVTECMGGEFGVLAEDLLLNYESKVDPRLNGAQAIELITKIFKYN